MKYKTATGVISVVLLCTPLLTWGAPQGSNSPRLIGNKVGLQAPLVRLADNYEFHTIDVGLYPIMYGINNARLAVGDYLDGEWGNANSYGFLWWNDRQQSLSYQGSPIIDMEKINNRGLVSGGVGDASRVHAAVYLLATGAWTLFPDVDAGLSPDGHDKPINFCMKANDAGISVGQACEGNYWSQENCVSWVYNGKSYSFLSVPGTPAQYTGPIAINDRGQIVGQYVDANGHVHSYFQQEARILNLDYPGASDTFVNDINNLGEVIVDAMFPAGSNQNYIWRKGIYTPIPNPPGSVTTYSHSLNDRGDYSGTSVDGNGVYHGFVALRKATGE